MYGSDMVQGLQVWTFWPKKVAGFLGGIVGSSPPRRQKNILTFLAVLFARSIFIGSDTVLTFWLG